MKLIIIFLFISFSSAAQKGPFAYIGVGATNHYLSHELHAGYKLNKYSASVGYSSMPENSQPTAFQVRAGYTVLQSLYVYAAAVRITYSSDDKKRNYNTWGVGVQYHTLKYDRGSVYFTTYYTPGYLSAGVGMSWGLVGE